MKIVLSHLYSWPEVRRGGERYLHELAAALLRAGHAARIVSTGAGPTDDTVLGVPVTRYRRRGRDQFGAEATFARAVLLREALGRADVWHALGTADAAAAARLSRLGRLRSVHTDLGGPSRAYRASRPDHARFTYAVRNLDAYVCLSRSTCDLLERDYGRAGVVVPGGVDLARFRPVADPRPTPTVLFASANDEPRKNLPLLLEAFDVLLTRRSARLVLAGPGDAAPALRGASARVRDAVEVADADADLAALYSAAWVTVLPSMREAFGLVLVESLACGTPIVAVAGSGGPAEIVDRRVGTLAKEPTAAALAAALDETLSGSYPVDTCRGAAGNYGWDEAIVPQLLAVYER